MRLGTGDADAVRTHPNCGGLLGRAFVVHAAGPRGTQLIARSRVSVWHRITPDDSSLPCLAALASCTKRGGANERRRAVTRRELLPLWGQREERSGVSRKRGGTSFRARLWVRLGNIVDCRIEAWRTACRRHRHRPASAF